METRVHLGERRADARELLGVVFGMRRDEADPLDAVDRAHRFEQVGEIGAAGRLAIGVDGLTDERDLASAARDFRAHVVQDIR